MIISAQHHTPEENNVRKQYRENLTPHNNKSICDLQYFIHIKYLLYIF